MLHMKDKLLFLQVINILKKDWFLISHVQDLIRLEFLAGNDGRKRRGAGEELRIGYSNGKQLLKRLELFGIGLTDVEM